MPTRSATIILLALDGRTIFLHRFTTIGDARTLEFPAAPTTLL